MIITLHCSVGMSSVAGSISEDIEAEVPDNFWELSEDQQYAELQPDYDAWQANQVEGGFSFSA